VVYWSFETQNRRVIIQMHGVIKWYNKNKHFGYLLISKDNREVFFHINDCIGFVPKIMMSVEFEYGLDSKGRSKAVKIKRVCVGG